MELKKAIERLKNTDIYNLGHNDRFEELRLYEIAIDTVLEELNNRIPIKDIEERLNKLKNKQKELDEEGFYGRYKKYGGKQKFEKYYAYINGTIQAYEELLNKE